ncbi:MAG: cation-transporting P-type ATPase [Verrucomicrobiales bacterium]
MNAETLPEPEATPWHRLETAEVARLLGSDSRRGLDEDEVAARLSRFGPNTVTARGGTPAWKSFLLQFHQPLVYILLVACGVTAFLHEWVDSSVIFAVVLVNAVIGFLQESKAEKAIAALSRMVLTEATVRRGGRKFRVPSADLVPGDVVLLQAGDRVPADLRLFDVHNLHCDESALTGESLAAAKHADPIDEDVALADRRNQAYAGTLVTAGQAEGVVWATGGKTETGRIARLISETFEIATPLTKKIAQFSRLLLWGIVGLAVLTFAVGVVRGESTVDMFMAAVALAVGAIPEGLPAAMTIVLAIGVSRMAKRRAVIRKLPAVETLGSTTVICSDKTGTLTQNQMTVQEVRAGGRVYEVTGGGYEPEGEIRHEGKAIDPAEHPALMECLRAGVLCNDSEVVVEEGRHVAQGDPTEAALLVAGAKAGLVHAETVEGAPLIDMIPFESEHMFRATLHGGGEGGRVIYKVGAVERLLDRCDEALGADGKAGPLDRDAVRAAVEEMAVRGLRVLALARRHPSGDQDELGHEHVQEGLAFLGLQGMIDPPREEAIAAVANCRRAGIQVKMITGDHAVTARVIAGRVGLADVDSKVAAITGLELEAIGDEELPAVAEKTEVFARVAPEQKLRLVRALQSRGHVVAMTGDGVNDAPALKQADIGVAMGISGTDVAKGAADMVLVDDNFASIEAAVEEGRGVFDNLTKFIVWTLPTNLGEGGIILVAIVLGLTLPVLPVQLLWVNMTTALLLGLMLVFEPKERGLMDRPPRNPKRPILTFPLFMRTGLVSLIIVGGGLWLFHDQMTRSGDTVNEARTAVINTIVLVETAYLFSCRSLTRSLFSVGLFTNRLAILGATGMVALQLVFTYAPAMNRLFQTTPLAADAWARILAVALFSFLAVELEKWIRFGRGRGGGAVPE